MTCENELRIERQRANSLEGLLRKSQEERTLQRLALLIALPGAAVLGLLGGVLLGRKRNNH